MEFICSEWGIGKSEREILAENPSNLRGCPASKLLQWDEDAQGVCTALCGAHINREAALQRNAFCHSLTALMMMIRKHNVTMPSIRKMITAPIIIIRFAF